MKKKMTIYDAQEKAMEYTKKAFTATDFAFQGDEEELEKQMDKVFQAILPGGPAKK